MIDDTPVHRRPDWRRALRAQLRDLRVLLGESRGSLIALFVIVFFSALIFRNFYNDPNTGAPIGFGQALYGAFTLLFFEDTLGFPTHWFLQMLYFIIPILGLVAVVDGVVRFTSALTNKRDRGQKWQVAMASTYNQHVIVCGIGKVGYRVARELLKYQRDVVAIEANPDCRFIEKAYAHNIPVIIANARHSDALVKAGIDKADAIIPCTDDELTNLDVALEARELNPSIKVVLRMFDPDLARRIETGFGIHTAFSVSALAAPTIAAAAMRVNVRSSFYIGDTLFNLSEIFVEPGSELVGQTVSQLEQRLNLTVISHSTAQTAQQRPDPGQVIRPGGTLLVLATIDVLRRLEQMNRSTSGK